MASAGIAMPIYDLVIARGHEAPRYRVLALFGLARAVVKVGIQIACIGVASVLVLSPQANPGTPTTPGGIAANLLIVAVSVGSCLLVAADTAERYQIVFKELLQREHSNRDNTPMPPGRYDAPDARRDEVLS